MTTDITFDNIILTLGAIVACAFFVYWHLDKTTRFDVRDLLVDKITRRLSLYKVGQFFALLVSTWVLIRETNADRLSEWLFIAYMIAWSGANLASKYLDQEHKPSDPMDNAHHENF